MSCDWQGNVCMTRAELKRRAVEALAMLRDNPDSVTARRRKWDTVYALAHHHCTPNPAIVEIEREMDAMEQLYARARYSADIALDHERKRQHVIQLIERYAHG